MRIGEAKAEVFADGQGMKNGGTPRREGGQSPEDADRPPVEERRERCDRVVKKSHD